MAYRPTFSPPHTVAASYHVGPVITSQHRHAGGWGQRRNSGDPHIQSVTDAKRTSAPERNSCPPFIDGDISVQSVESLGTRCPGTHARHLHRAR